MCHTWILWENIISLCLAFLIFSRTDFLSDFFCRPQLRYVSGKRQGSPPISTPVDWFFVTKNLKGHIYFGRLYQKKSEGCKCMYIYIYRNFITETTKTSWELTAIAMSSICLLELTPKPSSEKNNSNHLIQTNIKKLGVFSPNRKKKTINNYILVVVEAPIWKDTCSSNWIISARIGMNIQN